MILRQVLIDGSMVEVCRKALVNKLPTCWQEWCPVSRCRTFSDRCAPIDRTQSRSTSDDNPSTSSHDSHANAHFITMRNCCSLTGVDLKRQTWKRQTKKSILL